LPAQVKEKLRDVEHDKAEKQKLIKLLLPKAKSGKRKNTMS
jgi:hypothetical protein